MKRVNCDASIFDTAPAFNDYDVLPFAVQRQLIKAFQDGRVAEAALRCSAVDDVTRTALEVQVYLGWRAMDRLICSNMRLVFWVVARWGKQLRSLERDDLIQEGVRGLMRAIQKFDLSLGTHLSTYATWWIRQAMHRANMNAGLVRIPVHAQDSTFVSEATRENVDRFRQLASIDAIAEDVERLEDEWAATREVDDWPDAGLDIEACVFSNDDLVDDLVARELTDKALSQLSEREAYVLRCRCGLDGPPQTLEKIGESLNLTRERVRQIEKIALERSRKLLSRVACLGNKIGTTQF